MQRRDFNILLGSIAATWVSPSRAQQGSRVRRIGMLMGVVESDPEGKKYLSVFEEALRGLGWKDAQRVQIDFRAAADLEGLRSRALELADLGPEIIVTYTTPATNAVRQVTRSVPILFVAVSDPIGPGFVESFSRPGGNITGFTNFEATMGGKWIELLHDVAPSVKRVAMLFNPATANAGARGGVYFQSMEAAAGVLGIELTASPVSDPADIDRAFAAMAERPDGGSIVMPNVFTATNRDRIVAQAAQFRIPAVYPLSLFVTAGGLMSYGIDYRDQFRLAAQYADRLLKGGKAADLPVQQPTKFELTINRKTAKALDLNIPATLLARADEVIE
jgi:putative tryptophan/tyrosine transport system substrate-binding protein